MVVYNNYYCGNGILIELEAIEEQGLLVESQMFIPHLSGKLFTMHRKMVASYILSMLLLYSGVENMKCSVDSFDVSFLWQTCTEGTRPPVELEFVETAIEYMVSEDIRMPNNVHDAMMLYVDLVHTFESL